jgi:hypothetical protein
MLPVPRRVLSARAFDRDARQVQKTSMRFIHGIVLLRCRALWVPGLHDSFFCLVKEFFMSFPLLVHIGYVLGCGPDGFLPKKADAPGFAWAPVTTIQGKTHG